ncbi:hypothetical protein [Caproiciproducens sp. CPB-2]|uniref:hypothetical protein n=1 Tax=Caproiciproducens sp. CPB-2 TaxID=3030017 RepID=UPI0023DB3EA5|nr:hypothetical protein [Caproiciproducens sp. CPB-2]MDF1495477.1 hypothetical protein [Caproiciproducens sp. CPB-2]
MGAYGRYELEYVRTDHNGTKIYHDNNCPHCAGYGSLEKWAYTGKVCFECGGTGLRPNPKVVKIYTDEHRAKLDAKKAERDAKRLAENPPPSQDELLARARETVLNVWESQGFNRDGSGFIHSGDTYPNRDAIYEGGGRWCRFMKAYIAPRPIDGLRGVKITTTNAEALCNQQGYIDIDKAFDLRGIL